MLFTFAAMRENEKRPEVDIINTILEDCILAFPVSSFIISLYQQYQKRGFLTKKQLQGLHDKASKINDIAPGKLATLEARINKMPTRFKSDLPKSSPIIQEDNSTIELIDGILKKYPQHKRVLFLKAKLDNHQAITPAELADLERLAAILSGNK
jgi:hypothetical protein